MTIDHDHDHMPAIGLTVSYESPPPMPLAHRHNDVELNLVDAGALTYLLGGSTVTFEAGHLALFWGAIPHQLVDVAACTRYFCVTLPLPLVLHWPLGDGVTRRLLSGEPLVDRDTADHPFDRRLLHRWCADLDGRTDASRAIALLEMEARVRRLTMGAIDDSDATQSPLLPHTHREGARRHTAGTGTPANPERRMAVDSMAYVVQMAEYLVHRSAEPVRVAEVAEHTGLSPSYAMALFRERFGMPMGAFLTQYRIANAQRFLVTTDMGTLAIALAVGFGSLSRFYTAFKAQCGCSPQAYRARLRKSGGHARFSEEPRRGAE